MHDVYSKHIYLIFHSLPFIFDIHYKFPIHLFCIHTVYTQNIIILIFITNKVILIWIPNLFILTNLLHLYHAYCILTNYYVRFQLILSTVLLVIFVTKQSIAKLYFQSLKKSNDIVQRTVCFFVQHFQLVLVLNIYKQ